MFPPILCSTVTVQLFETPEKGQIISQMFLEQKVCIQSNLSPTQQISHWCTKIGK